MTTYIKKAALLISFHRMERSALSSRDAVLLYEALTCNGSIGPSDIILLAMRGGPYSDREPTIMNIEEAFRTIGHRSVDRKDCLVLLDGSFDAYGMDLPDRSMDLDLLSALIESLGCRSVQIFLHGPGSDRASERLQAPGRVLVYSIRTDRGDKLEDPFRVVRLFKGDEVHLSNVQQERDRLRGLGFELVWDRY
ncbi:MAG: hypothetical protein MUC62_07130 [Candidatus Thermoplasmatota archaeon]|jgi:hypothetical protein|nr:hypothetical protein [Candidatus Thermoplasmatota archaeon]